MGHIALPSKTLAVPSLVFADHTSSCATISFRTWSDFQEICQYHHFQSTTFQVVGVAKICSKVTLSAAQDCHRDRSRRHGSQTFSKIHVSKHTDSSLEMWECGGAVDRDRSFGCFVLSIACCRDRGLQQEGTATTTITTT